MGSVLIVDDREINRYIRSEILRNAGYESIEASTGLSALELCVSAAPDLVLLDIHLPDISGFEVCKRIKKNPDTQSIMVMQISASAVELSDALTGLDGGADDFLLEPIEPALLVAKVRSILRLRATEEKLRRSNNDLAQFAFVASHDLQEPMRAVTIYAQMLERDYRDRLDETGRMYLDQIIAGGRRMSALTRDLLEYSRVSSTEDRSAQSVDLNRVVAETREFLGNRLQEGGTVESDSLPTIQGPEVRIAQVFRNLFENAIKYRHPDRPLCVQVTATSRSRDWLVAVADNGKGFEPQHAETIFGVFRRLGGAEISGTGIGLAICRNIVEAAGGKIWAEGRLGQGATFFMSWPK